MNKIQGVRCNLCKDEIWSRSVHDYHHCKCGETSIDGGPFYLHYGWSEKAGKPEVVEIETNEKQSKKDRFPY